MVFGLWALILVSMFFIYAPIFVVESGMGETFSGFIVSIGISFVYLVPVWGKIGTRWGIRRLLTIGYIGAGTFAISISFMSNSSWVAIGLLILSYFCSIDDRWGRKYTFLTIRTSARTARNDICIYDVQRFWPIGTTCCVFNCITFI